MIKVLRVKCSISNDYKRQIQDIVEDLKKHFVRLHNELDKKNKQVNQRYKVVTMTKNESQKLLEGKKIAQKATTTTATTTTTIFLRKKQSR